MRGCFRDGQHQVAQRRRHQHDQLVVQRVVSDSQTVVQVEVIQISDLTGARFVLNTQLLNLLTEGVEVVEEHLDQLLEVLCLITQLGDDLTVTQNLGDLTHETDNGVTQIVLEVVQVVPAKVHVLHGLRWGLKVGVHTVRDDTIDFRGELLFLQVDAFHDGVLSVCYGVIRSNNSDGIKKEVKGTGRLALFDSVKKVIFSGSFSGGSAAKKPLF